MVAGDTLLTFKSGFYDAVLRAKRPAAERCWIVTQTPQEPRAARMVSECVGE